VLPLTRNNNTVNALENCELSIINELGAQDLVTEMSATIALSDKLLSKLFNPKFQAAAKRDPSLWIKRRTHIVNVLRWVFMPIISGNKDFSIDDEAGIALVFTHCCLDEPFLAAWYLFSKFPDKEVGIPIKLPWYEGIRHWAPTLRKVGVYLCPVISPKMQKQIAPQFHDKMEAYKKSLLTNYRDVISDMMSRHQSFAVAQAATRQRTIATSQHQLETGEDLVPTVRMIKIGARSAPVTALPVVVELPKFTLPEWVHNKYKQLPKWLRICSWLLLPLRIIYGWWPKFGRMNPLCVHHWRIGKPISLADCGSKNIDHAVITEMANICRQPSYLYPKNRED